MNSDYSGKGEEFSYYECQNGNFRRINSLFLSNELKQKTIKILTKNLKFRFVHCIYPLFLFFVIFFVISAVIDGLIYKIYYMLPVLLLCAYFCLELLFISNYFLEKSTIEKTRKKLLQETDDIVLLQPKFIGCGCFCFGIGSSRKLTNIHIYVCKKYETSYLSEQQALKPVYSLKPDHEFDNIISNKNDQINKDFDIFEDSVESKYTQDNNKNGILVEDSLNNQETGDFDTNKVNMVKTLNKKEMIPSNF